MEIVPHEGWEELAGELAAKGGAAMLLGTSDSGKSTLARYLIEYLLKRKKKPCFVDADVGQSSLSVPGTISGRRFRNPKDLKAFKPEKMIFAGVLNPVKNFRAMIDGTRDMSAWCTENGPGALIIDTTGLVAGEVGKALKLAKIKAVRPGTVVAVERKDELEHILAGIKKVKIIRLSVSPHVKRRTPAERLEYRERRFREYFRGAPVIQLPIKGIEMYYKLEQAAMEGARLQMGILIGLNGGSWTKGLGIMAGAESGALLIKTPVKGLSGIDRLVYGDISLPELLA